LDVQAHKGRFWALAFSPDGKLLATGGSSTFPHGPGEIKLWDVDTRVLRTSFLTGTLGRCRYLTFTPAGDRLAGICHRADGSVLKFWDVKTLHESRSIDLDSTVDWIAFSPDGTSFAISGESTIVSLWDTASLSQRCELKGHRGKVYHGTISPDGRTLATAGWNGVVKLWHVPTGQEMATLEATEGNVWSVAFSPDGLSLAAGTQHGNAGELVLWHVSSGKPPLVEDNTTD
jgi:WD40 repeat protein